MSNTRTTRPRASTARARQSKPAGPKFVFMGEEYRVADKIGAMPVLQLARAAEAGLTTLDQRGLAAFHAQLQDVIHEEDWPRFQNDMITKKSSMEDLMNCARQATEIAFQAIAKRQGRSSSNGQAKAELEG